MFTAALHPCVAPRSEIVVLPAVDKDPNSVACCSEVIAPVKRTLKAVGQPAAVVCVDGGLWSRMHQQLFTQIAFDKTILLFLGPFHVIKAYLAALGVVVKGTGWGQALIEARIVGGDASSIQSALSGEAVYRAIHCHAVVAQAMWGSLVSEFEQDNPEATGIAEVRLATTQVLAGLGRDTAPVIGSTPAVQELRVWVAGKAAGTIMFWWTYLQYHQKLENYMNTVRTAHTGGLEVYATALEGLLPLFVATNKTNYRRMIPLQLQLFSLVATKFPSLQQSLARGVGLAVSRTGLPDSLVGLDLAMEWVNRDCKGPCRLASFLQPEARGQFQRCINADPV